MSERYIIVGYGSIGKRHARNLQALAPDALITIIDPVLYRKQITLDDALECHDVKGAVIASPTEHHLPALLMFQARGIPVYCEKPVCTIEQYRDKAVREQLDWFSRQPWKCAIGFQYRYHPVGDRMLKPLTDHLSFVAQDDLMVKYGATVSETMASHSLDLALFAQGPVRLADLHSDGRVFGGTLHHTRGALSDFDLRIDKGPRQSSLDVTYERGGSVSLEIPPDEQMYTLAMTEWLRWVRERVRPARLARLSDGLRVMDLLSGVKTL